MQLDDDACYRSLLTRDPRFDGVFFVGVTTTGIYCRPVCTARTPGRDRCRFFASAALAESEGFRPCLRCRPELAPGPCADRRGRTDGPVGRGADRSRRPARRRLAGAAGARVGTQLAAAAARGASGVWRDADSIGADRTAAVGQATAGRIDAADGRGGRRQRLRERAAVQRAVPPPLRADAQQHAARLARRARRAIACDCRWPIVRRWRGTSWCDSWAIAPRPASKVVADDAYLRTAAIGRHRGWLRVEPIAGRNALAVELATSLLPVLPAILARLKHLFDLSARPDVIAACLSSHRRWRRCGACPGCACRGHSTVRVGRCGRFWVSRSRCGPRRRWPAGWRPRMASRSRRRLPRSIAWRLRPERLAASADRHRWRSWASADRSRRPFARWPATCSKRRVPRARRAIPTRAIEALVACPGIGPWTAQYIAMRALRWPDAFPDGDLGLLQASGEPSARALARRAESWRPWRAYAAMYLWESLHRRNNPRLKKQG